MVLTFSEEGRGRKGERHAEAVCKLLLRLISRQLGRRYNIVGERHGGRE